MEYVVNIPEGELVEQCRQGDEMAFLELVRRFHDPVRRTVSGMLGDTADAEDVAQETFIRFFRSLKQFREEASLGTYLSRIAINLSLNELKRRRKRNSWLTFLRPEHTDRGTADRTTNPDILESSDFITKALEDLEPDFRAVIVLRLIEGYSVKETAEILDIPAGTVASRLTRAQARLKGTLKRID